MDKVDGGGGAPPDAIVVNRAQELGLPGSANRAARRKVLRCSDGFFVRSDLAHALTDACHLKVSGSRRRARNIQLITSPPSGYRRSSQRAIWLIKRFNYGRAPLLGNVINQIWPISAKTPPVDDFPTISKPLFSNKLSIQNFVNRKIVVRNFVMPPLHGSVSIKTPPGRNSRAHSPI
jgi:hypothetical protein